MYAVVESGNVMKYIVFRKKVSGKEKTVGSDFLFLQGLLKNPRFFFHHFDE